MPKNTGGDIETVDQYMESTLESVDNAEALALEVAGRAGFQEEELHKIGMAVREGMVNAVAHGNRYNAHKKVHFSVSKTPDRFIMKIADQGEGFDPGSIPDPLAEENLLRHSGRGIFLMRAFMDEFYVRRADLSGGMEVTLVKYRSK